MKSQIKRHFKPNHSHKINKSRRSHGGIGVNQIMDYVKPELGDSNCSLFHWHVWLKQAQTVKDKYIPLLLGGWEL